MSRNRRRGKQRSKPNTPAIDSGEDDEDGRLKWTFEMSEAFLDHLVSACNQGFQADGGFKDHIFDEAVVKVTAVYDGSATLTCDKAKSKYQYFGAIWKAWEAHLNATSGWGNEGGRPTNTHEVMEEYFKLHPERKRFRDKAPDHLSQLQHIFQGRLATGSFAARPGQRAPGDPRREIVVSDDEVDRGEESREDNISRASSESRASIAKRSRALTNREPASVKKVRAVTQFTTDLGGISNRQIEAMKDTLESFQVAVRTNTMTITTQALQRDFASLPDEQLLALIARFSQNRGEADAFAAMTKDLREKWVERMLTIMDF